MILLTNEMFLIDTQMVLLSHTNSESQGQAVHPGSRLEPSLFSDVIYIVHQYLVGKVGPDTLRTGRPMSAFKSVARMWHKPCQHST